MKTMKAEGEAALHTMTALLRRYLIARRGWIVLMLLAVAAGAFFNSGWLVAAGAAPVLIALAPCLAMCALGTCMSRTDTNSSVRMSDADQHNAAVHPVDGAQRLTSDAPSLGSRS